VKRLSLHDRVEVLPALYGRTARAAHTRPVTPVEPAARTGARLTFEQRNSRPQRFPLEQSLAGAPEPPRLGRFLDIEV
jgi:hypothetical protein